MPTTSNPRLDIAIATTPKGLSLERELTLLKPALLYGDRVTMYSTTALMLDRVAQLGELDGDARLRAMIELTSVLDDTDEVRDALQTLIGLRLLSRNLPRDSRQTVLLRMQLDRMQKIIDNAWEPLRDTTAKIVDDAGFQSLIPAINMGLLQVHPILSEDESLREDALERVPEAFFERLSELLASRPSVSPLFDASTEGIARSLIKEGKVAPLARTLTKSLETRTAAGFLDFLPSFERATVAEILDIREELTSSLVAFRSATVSISRKYQADAFSPDVSEEIEQAWIEHAAPALEEIRERSRQNAYMRQLLGRLDATSLKNAGVVIGSLMFDQIPDVLSVAGLSAQLVRTAFLKQRSDSELRQHRFYLLHRTERLLDHP